MSFVRAQPLQHMRELVRPQQVLERLMRLLVRLARAGIVHGDFNELNLMIDAEEKVTLIDFPQIIHLNHQNAQEHFERDVLSICEFFRRRIGIDVEEFPTWEQVKEEVARAGGTTLAELPVAGVSREDDALLVAAHQGGPAETGESRGDSSESDSDEEAAGDAEAAAGAEEEKEEDKEKKEKEKG